MKKIFLPLMLLVMIFSVSSCIRIGTEKTSPENDQPTPAVQSADENSSSDSSPDTSEVPDDVTASGESFEGTPASPEEPAPTETASSEGSDLKASDFMPLDENVHMQYKGYGNEHAFFDTYVEYLKGNAIQLKEYNAGNSIIKVYEVSNGAIKKAYERTYVFYRYDFTSFREEEEILIKEPIAVGTSWTISEGFTRSITGVNVDVSTPSGQYKAIEVTTNGSDSVCKDYYARGVGLVKRAVTFSTDDRISSELERIEKGVPFDLDVRFYFPDFDNEVLVYESRTIPVKTNEDMKLHLQEEFKNPPAGSALREVLSPDVQILSLEIDFNEDIVTIDFSPELVNDMNAGSLLESLIINSIVSTLGDYYQVSKVIILVEGEPYSGGAIALSPGDYFYVDTSGAVEYQ